MDKEDKNKDKPKGKLFNYQKFYMVVLSIIGLTGLIAVIIGVRDILVMVISGISLIIWVWLYKRGSRVEKEKGKIKKVLYPLIAVMVGIISILITVDHIKYAITTGKIMYKEGEYTTVTRCVTDIEGSRSCLHESKDRVEIYSLDKEGKVSKRDITDTIKKYTEE